MKCFKLAALLCINTTLFPTITMAQTTIKDKDTAISPYNWTGLYAGVNAGAVKHTMNITDVQAVTFNATLQQITDPSLTGGLQIGYRRQLNASSASGVLGLELSTNFSNAESVNEYGSPFALYQLSSQHKLTNVTLAQVIAGITADRTLLFLAAGFGWYSISGSVANKDGIPFFNFYSVGKKELAVSLGCGIEYALNDKISARVKADVIAPETYSTRDNSGNSYNVANNIVQGTIGVNYRFG